MSELEYWKSRLAGGKVSRREFIGRAAALGLTTALATTLASKISGAEPKKGGSAKFGLAHGATTDSLDPGTWPDTFTQTSFWGSTCNGLTDIDTKGNIVGDLAETMEPSKGATEWIFKLRKGVTFHNGKNLTSADVLASFNHHRAENSKSAVKSVLAPIADIKADGADTVVFTLKDASADFPYLTSDYHIPILPAKDDGTLDWQSGIGTGAFILEKFEPGVSAKEKRNPNYHKSGLPYFDEVEFLALTDVTARTNALTTGEVQFIGRCDLKTLNLLQRNKDLEIDEVTGYGHYVLPMDTTQKPFDDVNVRTALKYALDREEVVKKIFLGHATVGNDNPIAPTIKYAIQPEPKYSYDVDKAKFYLKKSGLSSLKVDLSVADAAFDGAVDTGVLFKNSAAKAGIDINVVREPNDGYWDNVWLKKGWCASYWSGRPTCDWMFSTAYAAGAAWNETHWNNARFNQLLVAARGETDDKKRATMYAEMQQITHDDGGVIVLVFNNYVSAHSKKVAHNTLASNWENDGLRMAERWWFT
ncbi:peptide ABC transporter substrate-binding protein [Hypericibacter terrae]|jgi:peptide/nickel transport system substrate-binding protein|uniref:Peptide ABC transporter substrate-binding protein n=1 Tax=Hypericibacter terrae TaxID=2602015 RepID=A0A5J6MNC1_9PROT|nr:ABC transporter substrate-binding protein [Hypericibacter terrae]QEX18721.1 peptide ABC transporter substrate-binding protein [Hypericibacter terrae]